MGGTVDLNKMSHPLWILTSRRAHCYYDITILTLPYKNIYHFKVFSVILYRQNPECCRINITLLQPLLKIVLDTFLDSAGLDQ